MNDTYVKRLGCEVPGCQSVYCGKDHSGRELFKCGKADVTVHDHRGNDRGICSSCYLAEMAKAGKLANADLRDLDGRLDVTKIAEHYATKPKAAA